MIRVGVCFYNKPSRYSNGKNNRSGVLGILRALGLFGFADASPLGNMLTPPVSCAAGCWSGSIPCLTNQGIRARYTATCATTSFYTYSLCCTQLCWNVQAKGRRCQYRAGMKKRQVKRS